jgi:biopolymer transport protein ExbD
MIVLLFGLLAAPMQTTDVLRGETVSITIPRGRCRFVLNGRPIGLARLRKEAAAWQKTQPEVHFLPSPEAEYRCVDRVLRVLREASVTKLGFIGNEQAAGDEP